MCIFCDTHGCKVGIVNAKIHLVNDNLHLVTTICMLLVTIYILTELMAAMDGCVGTVADRLVIARTPSKVQSVINKVHLVSVRSQIAPCR
jgi:hypothetical protein